MRGRVSRGRRKGIPGRFRPSVGHEPRRTGIRKVSTGTAPEALESRSCSEGARPRHTITLLYETPEKRRLPRNQDDGNVSEIVQKPLDRLRTPGIVRRGGPSDFFSGLREERYIRGALCPAEALTRSRTGMAIGWPRPRRRGGKLRRRAVPTRLRDRTPPPTGRRRRLLPE